MKTQNFHTNEIIRIFCGLNGEKEKNESEQDFLKVADVVCVVMKIYFIDSFIGDVCFLPYVIDVVLKYLLFKIAKNNGEKKFKLSF